VRKAKVAIVGVIILLLTACGTEKEFNSLVEQAATHYDEHDLISARDVYAKALELKENPEVRKAYALVSDDIDMAKDVTAFREELRGVKAEIGNAYSYEELGAIANTLLDLVEEIKAYTPNASLQSGFYIRGLSQSDELDNLRQRSAFATGYVLTQSKSELEVREELTDAVDAVLKFWDYEFDNIK
jgi:cell division protein ZapA (FtsZ GTPase activity inhibitor)